MPINFGLKTKFIPSKHFLMAPLYLKKRISDHKPKYRKEMQQKLGTRVRC